VLALVGVNDSLVACASVTPNVALALLRPGLVTLIVAIPAEVAVKVEVALPPLGVRGCSIELGVNDPDTPFTEKVRPFVAVVTVFP